MAPQCPRRRWPRSGASALAGVRLVTQDALFGAAVASVVFLGVIG